MKAFNIKTVQDVKDFFKYLVYTERLNFNPDDPFEGNYDRLSISKAKYFDHLMPVCFDVCEKENADIYNIGQYYLVQSIYQSNPAIKQHLINGLTQQTEQMWVSHYNGFSATAFQSKNELLFDVEIVHGDLTDETVNPDDIFDRYDENIDEFTIKSDLLFYDLENCLINGVIHKKAVRFEYFDKTSINFMHPFGTIYVHDKRGYVANGYNWLSFKLAELEAIVKSMRGANYTVLCLMNKHYFLNLQNK